MTENKPIFLLATPFCPFQLSEQHEEYEPTLFRFLDFDLNVFFFVTFVGESVVGFVQESAH